MNKTVQLFLASGVINGLGYWAVDFTDKENPLDIANRNYLECYRHQFLGYDAAIELKLAISNSIHHFIEEIKADGYRINLPPTGFSFDLPLVSVENIFDFWFETYKKRNLWDKYTKLCKFRSQYLIRDNSFPNAFRGETSEFFLKLDELYSFRPYQEVKDIRVDKSMW